MGLTGCNNENKKIIIIILFPAPSQYQHIVGTLFHIFISTQYVQSLSALISDRKITA